MKTNLILLVLPVIGLLAGGAGGAMLHSTATTSAKESPQHGDPSPSNTVTPPQPALTEHGTGPEYVKLQNQFVVPVVTEAHVSSLIVISLSLEVVAGNTDLALAREPKLRDAFLQLFFDYANSGGFNGAFTNATNLTVLRKGLLNAAQTVLGPIVTDVLITEIIRQDN